MGRDSRANKREEERQRKELEDKFIKAQKSLESLCDVCGLVYKREFAKLLNVAKNLTNQDLKDLIRKINETMGSLIEEHLIGKNKDLKWAKAARIACKTKDAEALINEIETMLKKDASEVYDYCSYCFGLMELLNGQTEEERVNTYNDIAILEAETPFQDRLNKYCLMTRTDYEKAILEAIYMFGGPHVEAYAGARSKRFKSNSLTDSQKEGVQPGSGE